MSSCSSCVVDNFNLYCDVIDIEIDSHLCFVPASCVPSNQPDIPTSFFSKFLYIGISIFSIFLVIVASSLFVFFFKKQPNSLLNDIENHYGEDNDDVDEVHFSIDWLSYNILNTVPFHIWYKHTTNSQLSYFLHWFSKSTFAFSICKNNNWIYFLKKTFVLCGLNKNCQQYLP